MDLFSDTSSRSKRQEEAVQKWVNSKLVGTLMCPTGFGFCGTGNISCWFLYFAFSKNLFIFVFNL